MPSFSLSVLMMPKMLLDDQRRQPQRRLVEEEKARAGHQRAADGHHLLLAAAQGAGRLLLALLQDGEVVEDALDVLPHCASVAPDVGAEAQVLHDRQLEEDLPALGHLRDPHLNDLLRRQLLDGTPQELDAAPSLGAPGRRWSAASCSCPRRSPPRSATIWPSGHVEGHPTEGHYRAVGGVEIVDLEHCYSFPR